MTAEQHRLQLSAWLLGLAVKAHEGKLDSVDVARAIFHPGMGDLLRAAGPELDALLQWAEALASPVDVEPTPVAESTP